MNQSEIDKALTGRMETVRELAVRVGREALEFQQTRGRDGLNIETKGLQDFVTEADKKAEQTIRSELLRQFPSDGFFGEETGGCANSSGYWVVDPIDGTTNYLHGLGHWGVSIAYVHAGQLSLGVVHDTPNDRLYEARIGQGAWCNGQRIQVSDTRDLEQTLGILGLSRRTDFSRYLRQQQALYSAGIEFHRIGSAAIGLCSMAQGIVDFYYEAHLNSWDAMAGLIIAQEAGARVIYPSLDQFIPKGGEILCATPALHDELITLLMTN